MAFLETIQTPSGEVGLWRIEENEEALFQQIYGREPRELKVLHPSTSIQRVASRVLLSEMVGRPIDLQKDSNGKPSIPNSNKQVSISHTVGYAAVMLGKKTAIDVQEFRPKIINMADRFLDEREKEMAPDIEHVTLLWAAKETIYKYNGKPGLDFRDPISILRINERTMETVFLFNGRLTNLTLGWKILEGAVLVWLEE